MTSRGHPPLAVALLLGSVAVAACGGSSPVARGFDSRQVLPLRDPTTNLWTFTETDGDPSLIYSTMSGYFSLDVTTASVQSLGEVQPASITAGGGRYACVAQPNPTGGTKTLQIIDVMTGVSVLVNRVFHYASCPGNDGLLTAFVADPTTGAPILERGPFATLQAVTLSMNVQGLGEWLFDASGNLSGVLVAAASADAPDAFGLYTLDLGSYAFTQDVPPAAASTAWADGASPAGSLQSASLATGLAQAIRVVGDHFVYARTMSDGGTTMFVGPVTGGSASELALFQATPSAVSTSSVYVFSSDDDGVPVTRAPLVGWGPASVAGGSGSALMVWDDNASVIASCPSSPGATLIGLLSPDGSRALFADSQAPGSAAGAVTLLGRGAGPGNAGSCLALTTAAGMSADFSPDGQALYWTVVDGPSEGEIWAAAADGSNPRMIGSGAVAGVSFLAVPGSERLQFFLDDDFGWVDLRDNPIVVHDVVQLVFDGYYDLGNSWLLIGYDYSSQDGTGTLGFINRDTGATRPISNAVVKFLMTAEKPGPDAGAPDGSASADGGSGSVYDIVYLVRGRNPSAQDGFWVAKVNPADLR